MNANIILYVMLILVIMILIILARGTKFGIANVTLHLSKYVMTEYQSVMVQQKNWTKLAKTTLIKQCTSLIYNSF